MQFIVALCYDVLLEVLKHGKRRQLAILEAVGRRFQRIIDAKFIETPYLLLDLEFRWQILNFVQFYLIVLFRASGFYIRCNNSHSHQYCLYHYGIPSEPTPFIRFDAVKVCTNGFWNSSKCVEDIVALFDDFAFKASNLVVTGTIDESNASSFPSHTTMLDYLANELLPIFNSSRCCTFEVVFKSNRHSDANFVSSLLKLPSVVRKSTILVELEISINQRFVPSMSGLCLPADVISKWLNHSSPEGLGRNEQIRFLRINKITSGIGNVCVIFDHLKEVNFYITFKYSKI